MTKTVTSIDGVDMEKGLSYSMGQQAVYEKVLLEYVKSRDDFAAQLQKYYESSDWENYRIVAHSIKSSSYSVGAEELGDLAKEMEFAARDLDIDSIHRNNGRLKELFLEVSENIAEYLLDIVADFNKKQESDIDKLICAIDDFEQEKAIEILNSMTIHEDKKDIVEELRSKIENLEFFDAGEIVKLL